MLAHDYMPAVRYGAKWLASEVLPMGGAGSGNVYYVVKSTESWYNAFVATYDATYDDGSHAVQTDIQTALDLCVANRNDYVLVMPSASNYVLTATLTMSKANVHLICPAGLGCDIGAKNAARIVAYTGTNAITITGSSCEVAGLYIKNVDKFSGVYIGDGAHCTHIHNNHFPMTWSAGAQNGAIIAKPTGTGTQMNIERNYIFAYTGGGVTCANGVIDIGRTGDGYLSRVCNNIIQIGQTFTASIGIYLGCDDGLVANNIITSCGGGGTVTKAIIVKSTCSVIDNRIAVATGAFSTGGTAGVSYVNNIDGTATSGTDHWNLPAA